MKASEWVIVILLIIITSMGFVIRDLWPVPEESIFTEVTNGIDKYRVLKDSIYTITEINDEFGQSFYIKIMSEKGTTIIECSNDEWVESIVCSLN